MNIIELQSVIFDIIIIFFKNLNNHDYFLGHVNSDNK